MKEGVEVSEQETVAAAPPPPPAIGSRLTPRGARSWRRQALKECKPLRSPCNAPHLVPSSALPSPSPGSGIGAKFLPGPAPAVPPREERFPAPAPDLQHPDDRSLLDACECSPISVNRSSATAHPDVPAVETAAAQPSRFALEPLPSVSPRLGLPIAGANNLRFGPQARPVHRLSTFDLRSTVTNGNNGKKQFHGPSGGRRPALGSSKTTPKLTLTPPEPLLLARGPPANSCIPMTVAPLRQTRQNSLPFAPKMRVGIGIGSAPGKGLTLPASLSVPFAVGMCIGGPGPAAPGTSSQPWGLARPSL